MDAKLEVEDASDDDRSTSPDLHARRRVLGALERAASAEQLLDAADLLDAGIAGRLREIMAPLNRDPDLDLDYLPPLNETSLRSFLLFCCRAGPALDRRFSPGRDDDGGLGAQFDHPDLGTVSIDFRDDGWAWVAWANEGGRGGSGKCPASDLLTRFDPVGLGRWLT